jgi:hypothetical protein
MVVCNLPLQADYKGPYPHLLRRLLRHTDVGYPGLDGSSTLKFCSSRFSATGRLCCEWVVALNFLFCLQRKPSFFRIRLMLCTPMSTLTLISSFCKRSSLNVCRVRRCTAIISACSLDSHMDRGEGAHFFQAYLVSDSNQIFAPARPDKEH